MFNSNSADGWMDLQFYVLFNSISVISGQWIGDNERLCAMKPCLHLKRFSPQAEIEPGTTGSAGQCLTYRATEAPNSISNFDYLHLSIKCII